MAASKSPRIRLLHIRDEIAGVARIIEALSFEQYQQSYMHRRTIERAVEIVSEAAKALPRELLDQHPTCRGPRSSESATFCGTNINAWTIVNFEKLPRSISQTWNR